MGYPLIGRDESTTAVFLTIKEKRPQEWFVLHSGVQGGKLKLQVLSIKKKIKNDSGSTGIVI